MRARTALRPRLSGQARRALVGCLALIVLAAGIITVTRRRPNEGRAVDSASPAIAAAIPVTSTLPHPIMKQPPARHAPVKTQSAPVPSDPARTSTTLTRAATPIDLGKPWLFYRAGAWNIPTDGLDKAAALGMSVATASYQGRGSQYIAGLQHNGMRYIDADLLSIVNQAIPPACRSSDAPCVLTPADHDRVLRSVAAHLAKVGKDPYVVAYYVLDDYRGNIRSLLEEVRQLIEASNQAAGINRPAVCAYWAGLDYRTADGKWVRPRADFYRALLNFSPRACDAVAVYSYLSANVNPALADWRMQVLMPDVKRALGERGWTAAAAPLLGMPMAFGHPEEGLLPPTGDELAQQTEAYCQAGAVGILPYAWAEGNYHQTKVELGTSPDLQRGFRTGIASCRAVWGH